MRIARPWSLELAYTREMMAGLLLRDAPHWPRSALLVGLGAGSLAKFIYRNFPDCRSTVVEINPQVEFIARQYFRLPDDPPRLAVVIGDGADYMLAGERRFDYILVDGFDADARAGALDTLPFYQACRARLERPRPVLRQSARAQQGFRRQRRAHLGRFRWPHSGFSLLRQRQHHRLRDRRRPRGNHAGGDARERAAAEEGIRTRSAADGQPPATRPPAARRRAQNLACCGRPCFFADFG